MGVSSRLRLTRCHAVHAVHAVHPVVQAVPLELALQRLDEVWDAWFKFAVPPSQASPVAPAGASSSSDGSGTQERGQQQQQQLQQRQTGQQRAVAMPPLLRPRGGSRQLRLGRWSGPGGSGLPLRRGILAQRRATAPLLYALR